MNFFFRSSVLCIFSTRKQNSNEENISYEHPKFDIKTPNQIQQDKARFTLEILSLDKNLIQQ